MGEWFEVLSGEAAERLVRSLVHTLWQGVLVAGCLLVLLRSVASRHTDLRYGAAVAAQLTVLLCWMGTWAWLGITPAAPPGTVEGTTSSGQELSPASVRAAQPAPIESSPTRRPLPWAPLVAAFWVTGVGFMMARMLLLVAEVQRLASGGKEAGEPGLLEWVEEARRRLRLGRRVGVVVVEIASPAAVGLLWPTLLLPASMLSGVPPEHLRMIVAHELAHIRRHDYLINLGQLMVEALLFFNPAVWWISRQVRVEREACCDAAAVAITGRPSDYAKALAEWAEQMRGIACAPAVALRLDEPGQPTRLLDRVYRLLVPGYHPNLRLPWPGLVAVLLIGGLLMAGLWRGTTAVVTLAAEALTPKERMQRLEQVDRSHGTVTREYTDADNLRVSGIVRTVDGRPLPPGADVCIGTHRPRFGAVHGLTMRGDRFSHNHVHFGDVYVHGSAPGYAPTFVGPLRAAPGGAIENIEVVLKPGFTGTIRFVDAAGTPIPQARVSPRYCWGDGRLARVPGVTSDADGVARIKDCVEREMWLEVTAPGFELDQKGKTVLKPGIPLVWELRRARPATGRVVSRDTGKAIANAEIYQIYRAGPFASFDGLDTAAVLTRSDATGHFTLSSLREDSEVGLAVVARGHERVRVYPVRAGNQNLRIELGPPIHIRGTVVGDVEGLKDRRGRAFLHYSNPTTFGNRTYNDNEQVLLKADDGHGQFEIPDLFAGRVTIHVGGRRLKLDVTEPIDDLIIDLDEPERQWPKREVVLRFQIPDGTPAPRGEVRLSSSAEEKGAPYLGGDREIEDGQVRFAAYVPGRLSYESRSVIGYWFKEDQVYVTPGEGAQEIDVPTVPAGAIYGRVLAHDGSAAADISISCCVVKKAASVEERFPRAGFIGGDSTETDSVGRFLITPVPLGGCYLIKASRGESIQLSPPLVLSAAAPTCQVEIKMARGVTLRGQVLDPDRKPLTAIPVTLSFAHPHAAMSFGPATHTDHEGRFRLDNVNTELGTYTAELEIRRHYQPIHALLRTDGLPTVVQTEPGRVVEGRVVEHGTGYPVAGAKVCATRLRLVPNTVFLFEAEGKTDVRGRFRFSSLPEGQLRLNVWGANDVSGSQVRQVTAGQAQPVELRVVLPEWSKLKAVPPDGGN